MSATNPFTLPTLFRASGIHVPDNGFGRSTEAFASAGVHLRVHPHPLLGLPLHPFVAFPFHDVSVDAVDMHWTAPGSEFPGPFWPGGMVVHGRTFGAGGVSLPPEWVWLAVQTEAVGGGFGRIDVLARSSMPDGSDRVLATRWRDPFTFGGVDMGRLRATGDINVNGVLGVHATRLDVPNFEGEPPVRFGPNLEPGAWYDPGPDPRGDQLTRVLLGVPPESGPPDAPEGGGPMDPSTERDRIMAELGPQTIDPWLETAFGDAATPPTLVQMPDSRTTPAGVTHTANVRAVDALLTSAVDPEIARYLGLATVVPLDQAGVGNGPNLWFVGGRFIVQPGRRLNRAGRTLRQALDARPSPSWLPGYLDGIFPDAAVIAQRIADENAPLPPDAQWAVVSVYTVAAVAGNAPPGQPDELAYEIRGPGTWNPSGGEAPGAWTRSITLPGRHAEGPLALARLDQATGAMVSLHRQNPGGRAAAMLAGWSSAGDRVRTPHGLALQRRERTITDGAVPADASPALWLIWQADEWGRWSGPAKVQADPPPRPRPAPPVLELSFLEAGRDAPPGARPPGTLRIAVRVRRLDASAPGSLATVAVDLTSAHVTAWHGPGGTVAGDAARFMLPQPIADPAAIVTADLAPLDVGGRYDLTLTAIAVDVADVESAPETLRRVIHDPRRPIPVPTGPRILWASEPTGAGWSELGLRWEAATGARFRVYLGDEGRLAATLGIAVNSDELRATRAGRVWARSRDLADRRQFTLLTEQPIAAQGGAVAFRHALPGSLRGVQFVRVVPVSSGGLEADFAGCGLVPVAVPGDLAPPAPALDVAVGTAPGTLRVAIEARGLRADVIAARAPGTPAFRVRRTRGGATDLVTMPIVHAGDLRQDPDGTWRAEFVDGADAARPMPPFVRHTYLAEVRYPPEPDLPPGVQPVADALAVAPAVSGAPPAAASAWSAPSAPASSVVVPASPPPAPAGVTFAVDPVAGATITIPSPPLAHPAGRPFSALIVREGGDGRLVTLPAVDIAAVPAVVSDPGGSAAAAYRVAIVDPLGRIGPFADAQPGQ